MKANERGQVSPYSVADALAKLNFEVHRQDPFVGPNCVVIWRYRKDAKLKWGGGHQAYVGTSRDQSGCALPTLVCGLDMAAAANQMLAKISKQVGQEGWDKAASEMSRIMQEALAQQIQAKPDDSPLE